MLIQLQETHHENNDVFRRCKSDPYETSHTIEVGPEGGPSIDSTLRRGGTYEHVLAGVCINNSVDHPAHVHTIALMTLREIPVPKVKYK